MVRIIRMPSGRRCFVYGARGGVSPPEIVFCAKLRDAVIIGVQPDERESGIWLSTEIEEQEDNGYNPAHMHGKAPGHGRMLAGAAGSVKEARSQLGAGHAH